MRNRVSAIIQKNDKILLIRRNKGGKEYFVFPGGGIENDESVEDAIFREAKEEIGINISNPKKVFESESKDIYRGGIQKNIFYLVEDFGGEVKWNVDGPEIQSEHNSYKPVWMNIDQINKLENLYPADAKRKLMEVVKI